MVSLFFKYNLRDNENNNNNNILKKEKKIKRGGGEKKGQHIIIILIQVCISLALLGLSVNLAFVFDNNNTISTAGTTSFTTGH